MTRSSRTKESAAISGFSLRWRKKWLRQKSSSEMCLCPDRAVLKLRRLTKGLTDNSSMVNGDLESTVVCKSILVRIPAPRWPKRSWRTKTISTRPVTPPKRRRSPGLLSCRPNARQVCTSSLEQVSSGALMDCDYAERPRAPSQY